MTFPSRQKRTLTQNDSLHLWLTQVAEAMNDAGYGVDAVLKMYKEGYKVPLTMQSVKELLWRPTQRAMYHKGSTTKLDKQIEIDNIHKVIMQKLAEKFHLEYIPFPFECKECHGLSRHWEGCSQL